MCYTRRKIEGGVEELRENDDTKVLKPNGRSRNLNIYELNTTCSGLSIFAWDLGVVTLVFRIIRD